MFIQRQLIFCEYTSSQHSKWVKEVNEGMNPSLNTKFNLEYAQTFSFTKETYPLECISSKQSKLLKGVKRSNKLSLTIL